MKPVVKLPLPPAVLCCREAIDNDRGQAGRLFGRNLWISTLPPEEKKRHTGSATPAPEVAMRAIFLSILREPLGLFETTAVDLAGC